MWQEPIVNHRIKTAIEEGIASQSVAQIRRVPRRRVSILRGLFRRIGRLWNKGTRQTTYHQKAIGFRQSKETSI